MQSLVYIDVHRQVCLVSIKFPTRDSYDDVVCNTKQQRGESRQRLHILRTQTKSNTSALGPSILQVSTTALVFDTDRASRTIYIYVREGRTSQVYPNQRTSREQQ